MKRALVPSIAGALVLLTACATNPAPAANLGAPAKLLRIVYHTNGLYVRIPVESVDRSGRIKISSRKVRVTEEALYFDKKGVLQSVSYYQKTDGRELLLKGPYEYGTGFLAQGISIGYSLVSSIPEGLSFFTNTLKGSTNNPLWITDVFPTFFAKAVLKSGRRK